MNRKQFLKDLQKRHNLTNQQVADHLCCSLPSVEAWRNGRNQINNIAFIALYNLDADLSARKIIDGNNPTTD